MNGTRARSAPLPRQFRWIDGLGEVVAVSRVPVWYRLVFGALFTLLFGFAILVGGALLGILVGGLLRLPDWQAWAIAGIAWAAGLSAVGFWLGSRAFRVVVLYRDGIALQEAARTRAWRWEDIVAIERRPEEVSGLDVPLDVIEAGIQLALIATALVTDRPLKRVLWTYRFRRADDTTMMLDRWLTDVDVIANEVDRQVSNRLAPSFRARFERGEPVAFGPIRLARAEGIGIGGRWVAWEDASRLEIEGEDLHVLGRDGNRIASVPHRRLENPTLLALLLAERPPAQAAKDPGT